MSNDASVFFLIERIIRQDPVRMAALACARRLELAQGFLAAGFLRNLVWDYLHQRPEPTPLNDVDLIHFDPGDVSPERDLALERTLATWMPELNWQVKNQARLHVGHGHRPYSNLIEAMRCWPEKETAVAVRQAPRQGYECISAFGFESLLQGWITPNPNCCRTVFESRLREKRWLELWPQLKLAE